MKPEPKKGGLSLLIGIGGKPKAAPKEEDTSGPKMAGLALLRALEAKDGAAIARAVAQCHEMGATEGEGEGEAC